MKRLLIFTSCLLLFFSASSQKCPSISLKGPYTITVGDNLNLIAEVKGADANATLTYNWSISAGSISSGQGTSSITIDSKEVEGTITATVEIGGLPSGCSSVTSLTTDLIPAAKLILSANYTTSKALTASLQKFIKDTDMKNPENNNSTFIYIYRGATTTPDQFKQMNAAMVATFEKEGILSYQYKIADGGKKKLAFFEMYTMSALAKEPSPTK